MSNVINHGDALSQYGTAVYPSAAYLATPNTMEYELGGDHDELILVVDVTAQSGAGAITVKIEGVDRVSGKTFPLTDGTSTATTVSLTGNGTVTLSVGPSLVTHATAPIQVNAVVPPVVRITSTQTGTSCTYSVGLHLS